MTRKKVRMIMEGLERERVRMMEEGGGREREKVLGRRRVYI